MNTILLASPYHVATATLLYRAAAGIIMKYCTERKRV